MFFISYGFVPTRKDSHGARNRVVMTQRCVVRFRGYDDESVRATCLCILQLYAQSVEENGNHRVALREQRLCECRLVYYTADENHTRAINTSIIIVFRGSGSQPVGRGPQVSHEQYSFQTYRGDIKNSPGGPIQCIFIVIYREVYIFLREGQSLLLPPEINTGHEQLVLSYGCCSRF